VARNQDALVRAADDEREKAADERDDADEDGRVALQLVPRRQRHGEGRHDEQRIGGVRRRHVPRADGAVGEQESERRNGGEIERLGTREIDGAVRLHLQRQDLGER